MPNDTDVKLLPGQVKVEAWDLCLDSPDRRIPAGTSPYRRALVHNQNDGLTINYGNDYPNGVQINGKTLINGNTQIFGSTRMIGDVIIDGTVGTLKTNFGFYFQDRNKTTHPDSQWCWYAYEGQARLWSSVTGKDFLSIDGATGALTTTEGYHFLDRDDPNKRWCWYAYQGRAYLWSSATGKNYLSIDEASGALTTTEGYHFQDRKNPNSRWCWYAYEGRARLWNSDTGKDFLSIDSTGTLGALTTNEGYHFQDRKTPNSQWCWYAYEGRARLWSSVTGKDFLSVDADGTVNAPIGLKLKEIDVYQTILALQKEVADMKATVKKLEQQLATKPRA